MHMALLYSSFLCSCQSQPGSIISLFLVSCPALMCTHCVLHSKIGQHKSPNTCDAYLGVKYLVLYLAPAASMLPLARDLLTGSAKELEKIAGILPHLKPT